MKPTVLIIDDEEAIAWALRKACESQGYRPWSLWVMAGSGSACVH